MVIFYFKQRGFIQKFDSQFNLIWARAFTQNPGGATTIVWSTRRLAVMPNGDLNVIIRFTGTVDVDPDPISIVPLTAPHQGEGCHALLTLDSNGVYKDAQILSSGVIWDGISKLVNHNSHLFYSGTFYDSIQPFMSGSTTTITSAGLDDMMVVKLLSCNNSTVNTTATAWGSYTLSNGQVISQSGTYTDTLQTAAGCDSVLNINLTINPLPSTTLVWQGTTLHVQNTSPANTYQWLDCTSGQTIAGAIDSTFTPTANGSFAVVVNNGTCTDTSACETLTNFNIEESASTALIIYPNPTTGKLNISSSEKIEKIELYDLL